MFAPPWQRGLFAASTASELPALSGEQSQPGSFGWQSFGVCRGKIHAYCKSSKFGMFFSLPLITVASGFVELAGEMATFTIGFVPVRAALVSIMNGSLGGAGAAPPAGLGTPSKTGQRPLSASCLAFK